MTITFSACSSLWQLKIIINIYNKKKMEKSINEKEQCVQTDVICCDFFKQNIKEYGWFKLDHLGEEQYLMPHILGTKIRINYCPTCGKECRDTVLSADLYHSI